MLGIPPSRGVVTPQIVPIRLITPDIGQGRILKEVLPVPILGLLSEGYRRGALLGVVPNER